jgi:cation diffusion facilitator family transporter
MAPADARNQVDAEVRRILIAVLWLNLAVAAAKLIYGAVSGSVAIRADGIHSLFDGGSNVVGLIALWIATRPPDDDHPYGHRKVESVAALLIGVSVVIGLLEVVRSIVGAIRGQSHPEIGGGGFLVAGGTLAVNLAVSTWEGRAGRRLSSELLTADSRHTLGDSIATIGVMSGFAGVRMGYPTADLAAACVVSVLIGHTAWQVFRRAFHSLLDSVELDPRAVVATAMSLAGVVDCHAVRSRAAGGQVHVDLHIHVAPEMTVAAAHDLTHAVEGEIRRRFPNVADVIIHTEPVGAPEP